MNSMGHVWAGWLALSVVALPRLSLADIPPRDQCARLGAECTNAGPSFDQPGSCKSETCTKRTPDGSSMSYECLRCVASSGAGGSASTTGGAAATTGGSAQAGSSGAGNDDDEGGCRVSPATAQGGAAALMVALGLTAAFAVRRRR